MTEDIEKQINKLYRDSHQIEAELALLLCFRNTGGTVGDRLVHQDGREFVIRNASTVDGKLAVVGVLINPNHHIEVFDLSGWIQKNKSS